MSEKIKDLEGEIWKDIEGYEGYYQISNKGRLKSKLRSVNGKLNSTLTLNPRLYKGYIDKKGYVRYSLSREHKMVRIFSHVLVAKHFILNLENKPQINHKNGIKTNNRVENLEWCTCKENVNHAHRTNLIKLKTGEDHCNSFLTNQQVIDIREELSQYSVINLAKKYNVDSGVISAIKLNKTYKNIKLTSINTKTVSSFYNKLLVFNLNGEFIEEFKTQKDFCIKYSKSQGNLSREFSKQNGDEIVLWGFKIRRLVNPKGWQLPERTGSDFRRKSTDIVIV